MLLSCKCFGLISVFIWSCKASRFFFIYLVITTNTVSFVVKIFLLFVLRYFVSGACLFVYYTCLLVCLLWVCWVRRNFSGRPGHVLSVRMWLRCVECRAGTILFRHSAGTDGGAVHIFLSL